MDLLAPHDPVFVVDLTPEAMDLCRASFGDPDAPPHAEAARPPAEPASRDEPPDRAEARPAPAQPIRAVALLFARDADPVLLSIRPTLDTAMLDAMARLVRSALLTRRSVASLVTEAGDAELKRLYFARALPRFIYDGVPAPVRHRIPEELRAALGRRARRGSRRGR